MEKRLIVSGCCLSGEWGRMDVLDGVHFPNGRKGFRGFSPIGLNGVFKRIFKTEMNSTRVQKVYNISVRTIYQWKCCFFLKMYFVTRWKLAFTRNMLKCNSDFTNKSLDFTVNCFFMKLLRTSDISVVHYCQSLFGLICLVLH